MIKILSLIIPTKNRANVLENLLLYLNNQIGKFEVIIIDDNSKDDTFKMVKSIKNSLKYKIKYIKLLKEVGLPTARNIGIKYSSFSLIGFLDDDCLPIKKDLFLRANKWLNSPNHKIVGVGGPVYTKSNKPNDHDIKIKSPIGLLKFISNYFFNSKLNTLHYTDYIPGGNCFFKKGQLCQIKGFDIRFGGFNSFHHGNFPKEDDDICMRIKKYGNLIIDPKMCVNHLKVSTGGERVSVEEIYPNNIANTILFILKHKKINLRLIFVFVYHIYTIFQILLSSSEENPDNLVNKKKLLYNLFKSLPKGFLKYFIFTPNVSDNLDRIGKIIEDN